MSQWYQCYASRERRRRARLLVALALAAAALTATRLGAGGQTTPAADYPAPPSSPPAILESQPPLLMYNVRFALDQMERQV